jgi:hypothetical protein
MDQSYAPERIAIHGDRWDGVVDRRRASLAPKLEAPFNSASGGRDRVAIVGPLVPRELIRRKIGRIRSAVHPRGPR